ncbi:DNA-binding protein [Streptosporangium sp. NPDC001559]|uniref:DNA-binding protein n=1 Tax=Streptosporangium sp. NPDC001559 TaxID=3366187 RepID=UPI0036EBF420
MSDVFTRPDSGAQRAERGYHALTHLVERHAGDAARRARQIHPDMPAPHEVVRLVAGLVGGSICLEAGEPVIDHDDLVAVLTLLPGIRADLESTELFLLTTARKRGMTWQDIAFSLGLNTAQAARQRYERLAARSESGPPADS